MSGDRGRDGFERDDFEKAVGETLGGMATVYPATLAGTRAVVAELPDRRPSGWWWFRRPDPSFSDSPVMALVGVAILVITIVAVSVLGRLQAGPATVASPTPIPVGSPSPVPTAVAPTPTEPVFHETLPVVYTGKRISVAGWSPDGSRFAIASDATAPGESQATRRYILFDRSGAEIWSVQAADFAWVDANTYVVLRSDPSLSDPLQGGLTAFRGRVGSPTIDWLGTYARILPGGSGAVAMVLPWNGTVASSPYYEVLAERGWNMAKPITHEGYPIAWSRDGTALALLHPVNVGAYNSPAGWIEVVTSSGQRVAAAPDIRTDLLLAMGSASASFSPDGSRLAFADDTNILTEGGPGISILELASGRLTTIPSYGEFTWASNDELLIVPSSSSDEVDSWSAVTGNLTPYGTGTDVGASGNGLVVIGTQNVSQLSVVHRTDGQVKAVRTLTLGAAPMGGIPDAAWSPDGLSVLLVSGQSSVTNENLVLAQF
jgi:WD40-like Beta Propeller Repeat